MSGFIPGGSPGGARTGASQFLTILDAMQNMGGAQPGGGAQGRPSAMGFWDSLAQSQQRVNPNATPFSALLSLMTGKGLMR